MWCQFLQRRVGTEFPRGRATWQGTQQTRVFLAFRDSIRNTVGGSWCKQNATLLMPESERLKEYDDVCLPYILEQS